MIDIILQRLPSGRVGIDVIDEADGPRLITSNDSDSGRIQMCEVDQVVAVFERPRGEVYYGRGLKP